jgi:hypothetical protein
VVGHGVARDDLCFVAKPFTRESLLGAVSEALSPEQRTFTALR